MMEAKSVHLLEITLLIGAVGRAAKDLFGDKTTMMFIKPIKITNTYT